MRSGRQARRETDEIRQAQKNAGREGLEEIL